MDSYSEHAHQQAIRRRLEARGNGFRPFSVCADDTISRAFSRQARVRPQQTVVESGDDATTYAQLQRCAAGIRHLLGWHLGAGSGPIALLISNHALFIAGALAVLRSGGSYVPLDPDFPEERNARILRVCGAPIVLTERSTQDLGRRLALPHQRLLSVDEAEPRDDEPADESRPDGLAYVIFTSGSTGTPKGVMQTHQNILHVVRRYTNSLYLGSADRISLISSCSVTASVAPLLSSLLNGATLFALAVRQTGLGALAEWLDARQITLYHSVPSLFRHLMMSVPDHRIFPSVQVVRLGGDSVYRSDWELFKQHFPRSSVLVNSYGCSEISSVARFYMDGDSRLPDSVVPVGQPMDGVEIAVLGSAGEQNLLGYSAAPADAASGEILLKSRHLSPGYWHDEEATARAFTPVANGTGLRSYQTGDLGVVRGEQGLVHLGRADSQVKLSGYRVEIAEVEACLRELPGVRDAAVIVHGSERADRELLGFIALEAGRAGTPAAARAFVQARLPAHMVPSEVILIPRMPCTPNGKVDRAALISLRDEAHRNEPRLEPSTCTERLLADLWKQVLKLQAVGIEDDFFALGGNSLLGMELVARAMERLGVQLDALVVFRHPTIRQLALHVDGLLTEQLQSPIPQAVPQSAIA